MDITKYCLCKLTTESRRVTYSWIEQRYAELNNMIRFIGDDDWWIVATVSDPIPHGTYKALQRRSRSWNNNI